MTVDKVELKYGPVVLECASRSEPERVPYRVRFKNGHYSCNCKGWIFSKDRRPNGDRTCKHTITAERLEITVENQGLAPVDFQDNSQLAKLPVIKLPITPILQEDYLLTELLRCLGTLQTRITEDMKRKMKKILGTVQLPKPTAVPTPLMPMSGIRRIVFDD